MEKLLPYYELELSLLRRGLREFAQRFPTTAARLGISDGKSSAPGIERALQGAALLTGHIARKLDYGYVKLESDLLGIQSPFYLRPIPSSSVVQREGAPG